MELDGYVLYEAIAFGSSGPLWRAVDMQGRNFALQMLPGPPDADLQQRLGVLTSLRHPNLLTCHQTRVTTDGRHVVLFDYLQGVDLEVYRRLPGSVHPSCTTWLSLWPRRWKPCIRVTWLTETSRPLT